MNKVYLLLGGNLGERFSLITNAKFLIKEQIGEIIKQSALYETEPWGFETKQNFLNQVIIIETELQAHQLLKKCLTIENELGRKRIAKQYSSRTMDIDILFFNEEIINTKDLVVPHPKLHERRFTLEPLVEISPDLIHPVFKRTLSELFKICKDHALVKKI